MHVSLRAVSRIKARCTNLNYLINPNPLHTRSFSSFHTPAFVGVLHQQTSAEKKQLSFINL
jgi:hypothetical protein